MQRVLFALVVVVWLTACGAAAAGVPEAVQPPAAQTVVVTRVVAGDVMTNTIAVMSESADPMTDTAAMIDSSTPNAVAAEGEQATGEAAQIPDNGRKIVYNANVTLEVDDPRQTANALYGIATKYGGFVSSGNVYEYGEDEDGNPVYRADIQLRVEASNFNLAQRELRELANSVLSEKVDTQDVTGEYVDVDSRVRNLKRLEEEMQILLTDARARAGEMEDILTIYRELTAVRAEIEQNQGRLNVLSDLVGLATINVTLVAPPIQEAPEVVEKEWSLKTTTREAYGAFVEELQGVADSAVWFAFLDLPRLLLNLGVLLIIFLIARRVWVRILPYLMGRMESRIPPQ